MIVFTLESVKRAYAYGKWNPEGKRYMYICRNGFLREDLRNRKYRYRWPDGWEVTIDVREVSSMEGKRLINESDGFGIYEWMIKSIQRYGQIITEAEAEMRGLRKWKS